jgi:hypothetical protein
MANDLECERFMKMIQMQFFKTIIKGRKIEKKVSKRRFIGKLFQKRNSYDNM